MLNGHASCKFLRKVALVRRGIPCRDTSGSMRTSEDITATGATMTGVSIALVVAVENPVRVVSTISAALRTPIRRREALATATAARRKRAIGDALTGLIGIRITVGQVIGAPGMPHPATTDTENPGLTIYGPRSGAPRTKRDKHQAKAA